MYETPKNPLGSVRNWQTTPTNTRQSPSSPLLHHHLHPSDSSTIKRAYTMARITVQSTNTSRAKPYTIQVEIGGCTFDRPLLGEFYSYENDFATHTSLKENEVIDRRCYRQESGAGVTRNDG
ncbi:unnamed protein product [Rotaria socialis]|uniref:Uncharacterized protein n=1 Tax=Rotaria socialis TaxID=392032 RepID=A0A818KCH7_9BILA|nr:unnamed protein product [Rotaria socialis]